MDFTFHGQRGPGPQFSRKRKAEVDLVRPERGLSPSTVFPRHRSGPSFTDELKSSSLRDTRVGISFLQKTYVDRSCANPSYTLSEDRSKHSGRLLYALIPKDVRPAAKSATEPESQKQPPPPMEAEARISRDYGLLAEYKRKEQYHSRVDGTRNEIFCSEPGCLAADFRFADKEEWQDHMYNNHPELTAELRHDKPRFQCEPCNRNFTRRAILLAHQRAHHGQKPFECSQCGRTFVRMNDCDRHEKMHRTFKDHGVSGNIGFDKFLNTSAEDMQDLNAYIDVVGEIPNESIRRGTSVVDWRKENNGSEADFRLDDKTSDRFRTQIYDSDYKWHKSFDAGYVSSIHHRSRPILDFASQLRRWTIREFMAQMEMPKHRIREDPPLAREEIETRSRRAPHPTAPLQQEYSRQPGHREFHRGEGIFHQASPANDYVPSPSLASQMGHLPAFGGGSPRVVEVLSPLKYQMNNSNARAKAIISSIPR